MSIGFVSWGWRWAGLRGSGSSTGGEVVDSVTFSKGGDVGCDVLVVGLKPGEPRLRDGER